MASNKINAPVRLDWLMIAVAVVLVGLFAWASLATSPPRPVTVPATAPTTAPVVLASEQWETVPNCESEATTLITPCFTVDQGHWIVVLSYQPYHVLVLDSMAAIAGESDPRA